MAKAEAADAADIPDGMSIPAELARREERLRKIAEARTNIEARAKERHAREMAEYEAALATPRLRPRAKSPAASRPSFQPRGLCRAIRLISPTKTRASCSAGDGNLPIWPATDSQRFAWIVPSHSKQGLPIHGCIHVASSTKSKGAGAPHAQPTGSLSRGRPGACAQPTIPPRNAATDRRFILALPPNPGR